MYQSSNDKKEFMSFIEDKLLTLNVVSEHTASNLRVVSQRMINYIPDDKTYNQWDVDDVIFAFSQMEDVSDSALKGYRTRLKSAIDKFIDYKNGTLTSSKKAKNKNSLNRRVKQDDSLSLTKTFLLPIPLRDDLILSINNLPLDLTEEEADKISRIIKSYATVKNE